MKDLRGFLALPLSLCALLSLSAAEQDPLQALRKLSPDLGEKLNPDDLAFVMPFISPRDAALMALDGQDPYFNVSTRFYPAYAPHFEEAVDSVLRRAAEALAMLERRAGCPSGMNSCEDVGAPNKCCQDGTYCNEVDDDAVGGVACCPDGSECGGDIGECPADAVSCPASLGGGCCIAGYICQGVGCRLLFMTFVPKSKTDKA